MTDADALATALAEGTFAELYAARLPPVAREAAPEEEHTFCASVRAMYALLGDDIPSERVHYIASPLMLPDVALGEGSEDFDRHEHGDVDVDRVLSLARTPRAQLLFLGYTRASSLFAEIRHCDAARRRETELGAIAQALSAGPPLGLRTRSYRASSRYQRQQRRYRLALRDLGHTLASTRLLPEHEARAIRRRALRTAERWVARHPPPALRLRRPSPKKAAVPWKDTWRLQEEVQRCFSPTTLGAGVWLALAASHISWGSLDPRPALHRLSEVDASCWFWFELHGHVWGVAPPRVWVTEETPAGPRLHNSTGPAVVFADGSELYALHGHRLAADVGRRATTGALTPEDITGEENAETRAELIRAFGMERFFADGAARLIDTWVNPTTRDPVKLWRLPAKAGESLLYLELINSTPEPDGTRKVYVQRVPPRFRCAKHAYAWTWNLPVAVVANTAQET